jgi:hypothetical protein
MPAEDAVARLYIAHEGSRYVERSLFGQIAT